jgi:hypothetical protein
MRQIGFVSMIPPCHIVLVVYILAAYCCRAASTGVPIKASDCDTPTWFLCQLGDRIAKN